MLTKGQQEALDKCLAWFKDEHKKQVFRIYGSAGSGKSFLVGEIIKRLNILPEEVALCAPTGKAATILMQRFNYMNTSTLHSLIYIPYTKDKLIVSDSNEIEGIESNTDFALKQNLDFRLIVLDEVSMVDEFQMNDLLSFGIPVIAVGDPYQLPPINGSPLNPAGADALLTEIVRQAADNPIITLANDVRLGKPLKYGRYGDKVVVMPKYLVNKSMLIQLMESSSQVICGLNATRRRLNAMMRKHLNRKSVYPEEGDKLICKSNEHFVYLTPTITLCNGMIGKCVKTADVVGDDIVKLTFKPDIVDLRCKFVCDAGVFSGIEFKYDPHWTTYKLSETEYVAKKKILPEMMKYDAKMYLDLTKEEAKNKKAAIDDTFLTRFDFAYAISCHASQGSEFDNVLVIDESAAFRNNASRWLYTAMTRAKKTLIIVR